MKQYRRIAEQAAIEPDNFDNELYVAADTTITLYDEGEKMIGEAHYDDDQWTNIGDAVLDSLDESDTDIKQLEQAETVYLGLDAPADSIAGMDTSDLDEHIRMIHDGSPFDEQVMDHEYLDGVCNDCGSDMDFLVADPEKEGLDVYMYNCDDCGNTGHYFGGQETEDGSVTVRAEITSTDAVASTAVDIRDNASFTAFDLDQYKEREETERVAVTDPGQLDASITIPEGGTVRIYPVDAPHDVESVREEEIVYEQTKGDLVQTTVGEVLTDAAEEESIVHEYLSQLDDDHSITIDLEAPADKPNGFAQERFNHSKYMDPLETATFVENQSMRRLDGTVESLLTHVLHDYGQEWKGDAALKHMKGGRPPIVPASTEHAVEEQLENPNFGLIIEDQTGGSDIDEPSNDTYTKIIDESTLTFKRQE